MGDGLEDRYKDQCTDTHHKDKDAEVARNLHTFTLFSRTLNVAFQREAYQPHGDGHTSKAGEQRFDNNIDRRHLALNPKHNSRNISDGAPSTTGIGGKDDHTCKQPTLFLVGNKFAQQGHHHDSRGHIVEQCRQKEGKDGDYPQQPLLVGGLDLVGYNCKTLIVLNQGDNCHCTKQEEDNLCSLAKVLNKVACYKSTPLFNVERGVESHVTEREDGPRQHAEKQCRGGFVDFQRMLERDASISDYKNSYQCYYHS